MQQLTLKIQSFLFISDLLWQRTHKASHLNYSSHMFHGVKHSQHAAASLTAPEKSTELPTALKSSLTWLHLPHQPGRGPSLCSHPSHFSVHLPFPGSPYMGLTASFYSRLDLLSQFSRFCVVVCRNPGFVFFFLRLLYAHSVFLSAHVCMGTLGCFVCVNSGVQSLWVYTQEWNWKVIQ